jgi:dTDP-4-amino-4,6-dideoxygalactose transaminase
MDKFTIPFFPPLKEYQNQLEKVWDNQWITNNGPILQTLEKEVSEYLGTSKMSFVSNGTIAIQIAIEALGLKGEIITTPFSYVATSSAIKWQKCTPIFVDINYSDYAINAELIESKITNKTCAILATHIFGNPCDIQAIEAIAKKHNLKVIYDASHCFGTEYNGESIFNFGDISTCSFHATKLFHTIEGGAIFSRSKDVLAKANLLRNFGHNGPEKFSSEGINGKNSEVHAAMGLTNLPYIEAIRAKRKHQFLLYKNLLQNTTIKFQELNEKCDFNYAYCSIVIEDEASFNRVLEMTVQDKIGLRRYFYPSLNTLPYYNPTECAVSEKIAESIFCLPMHFNLTDTEIETIVNKIKLCL